MAKVSIIIPVYKVEEYLHQCLDSVVGQTLRDIEIICVNDGSPDNCDKILQEYAAADDRIKIINQENAGLAAARNTGLPAATGEYVGFLDSDDWVSLDFYERLYNIAKHYDADVAGGGTAYMYGDKKKHEFVHQWCFRTHAPVRDGIWHRRDLCHACACWNKIYRREFIAAHGLRFPHGKLVEDFPFTFMANVLANKIVMDDAVDYFYRQRTDSIMGNAKVNRAAHHAFDNHLLVFDLIDKVDASAKEKILWRKIAAEFLLDNMLGWMNMADDESREELFKRYKEFVTATDWNGNEFLDARQWGIIKVVPNATNLSNLQDHRQYWRVFGISVAMRYYSPAVQKYFVLGMPILKTKHRLKYRRHYLFGFIPIRKITM